MLPNRLEVQLRGASARLACGADVGSAAGRLVTSEYAVNGVSCLRCPDVAKVQSIQVNILLPQKASPPFPVRRSSILSGWRPALWKKPAGFPGYEGQTRMGHWDL